MHLTRLQVLEILHVELSSKLVASALSAVRSILRTHLIAVSPLRMRGTKKAPIREPYELCN